MIQKTEKLTYCCGKQKINKKIFINEILYNCKSEFVLKASNHDGVDRDR